MEPNMQPISFRSVDKLEFEVSPTCLLIQRLTSTSTITTRMIVIAIIIVSFHTVVVVAILTVWVGVWRESYDLVESNYRPDSFWIVCFLWLDLLNYLSLTGGEDNKSKYENKHIFPVMFYYSSLYFTILSSICPRGNISIQLCSYNRHHQMRERFQSSNHTSLVYTIASNSAIDSS